MDEDGVPPADGWGPATYGDPCRQCGYSWSLPMDEGRALVTRLPLEYTALVDGASGRERHPDLAWPVVAYVCHVGDNLRIWAERLAGVARGAGPAVIGYDETALGKARGYEEIPLPAALWTLGRAVADWQDAVDQSPRTSPLLLHPEQGALSLEDVVAANAHDGLHHRWDIARTLAVRQPPLNR